eukprot:TRINITY_DN7386_c0_g1_i1.p1 TRINITY_DN7386_c0_g1~~TRINITY_DN7386_c0_g1_i1.p1  ORF type:complete len:759 (+),score=80.84 TRINITY_DN7386_c0_g1_i1:75-2351(+)
MATIKVKCGGSIRPYVFDLTPVTAEMVRDKVEEENRGLRVTRVVAKGKTLGPDDQIKLGTPVLVVGEQVFMPAVEGDRANIVDVYDVMNNVFSYLTLTQIRLTCMRVCTAWMDMAETETRNHVQRYTLACGELMDLFNLTPEPLLGPSGIPPHTVVHWVIYEGRLFLVVAPSGEGEHQEGAAPAAVAAMDVDAGDDDDSSSSSDPGDPDAAPELWPELDDPDRDTLAAWAAENEHGWAAPRPRAAAIQQSAETMKKQQSGYSMIGFDLVRRQIDWRRDDVFRQSKFPVTGLYAGQAGPIVQFWDRLLLLKPTTGTFLNDYVREDPVSCMFRTCMPMAPQTISSEWKSHATHWATLAVPQGGKVHMLDANLRPCGAEVLSLPGSVNSILGQIDNCMLYETQNDTIVCARLGPRLRGPGKVRWSSPAGDLLHVSDTNVLWRERQIVGGIGGGQSRLFDMDARNFDMWIGRQDAWRGGSGGGVCAIDLLEGPPPERFAQAVLVVDAWSQRDGPVSGAGITIDADEMWQSMELTDDVRTLPTATNTSRKPFSPNEDRLRELEQKAPPCVHFDKQLPLTHPTNVAARAFDAFERLLLAEKQAMRSGSWEAVGHGQISLRAITREQVVKRDWTHGGGAKYSVQRGFTDVWSIHVPFDTQAVGCHFTTAKIGNYVYFGFLDRQRGLIGVYAVAVDRGFTVWRKLWQDSHCECVDISVKEQALLVEVSRLNGARVLYMLSRNSGAVRGSFETVKSVRRDPAPAFGM